MPIDIYEWLINQVSSLPVNNIPAYKAILERGNWKFSESKISLDIVDCISLSIALSTKLNHSQIFISFPDKKYYRGPLLLATPLIIDGVERVQSQKGGGKVLYFGATIGIREDLSKISINNLSLGSIFPSSRVNRNIELKRIKSSGSKKSGSGLVPYNLSEVICVYSPSDPQELCQKFQPDFVVIDCAYKTELNWLNPLLDYIINNNIPAIAWGFNPLSDLKKDFKERGVLQINWPCLWGNEPKLEELENVGDLFEAHSRFFVQPFVVEDKNSTEFYLYLRNAFLQTSKISYSSKLKSKNMLLRGAIQICWRYLRILEKLSVPLDFYESEASNYWGISGLHIIGSNLEKYLEKLDDIGEELSKDLHEIKSNLDKALACLEANPNPLWVTLVNLCVGEIDEGKARVFVFQSNSAKKMFSLALLAYHNITEDDLLDLDIGLITLRDIFDLLVADDEVLDEDLRLTKLVSGMPTADRTWEYWFVGYPSSYASSYMSPLLLQNNLFLVIYPYQLPALDRKIEAWNQALSPNISKFIENLEFLLGEKPKGIHLEKSVSKLEMLHSIVYQPDNSDTRQLSQSDEESIWGQYDSLDEIDLLLAADNQEPNEMNTTGIIGVDPKENDPTTEIYDEAWLVTFENGEKILFQIDGAVNVVVESKNGLSSDERYVSSLRPGYRILFIHSSRKQSLLDLLIERIYQHPAINLHIKMVERWQEDFAAAFNQKMKSEAGWGIDNLFQEMVKKGTGLTTSQAFRHWLKGNTLRPQDPEDLRRLAEIFSLAFIREHYKRIHRSGGRIHGLHVSLSRKLNEWIEEGGQDLYATKDSDILDDEIGLSFQDFRSSISVLKVKFVSKEKGLFTAEMFGIVMEE